MNNPHNSNNKNAELSTADTKNKILGYLYKSGIKIDTRHESILSMKDMDNIRDGDYVICPRFTGTRSWIIFFSIDESYFAVSFPKHSQRKREEIRIYPIDISVRKNFYRGTIMEGIYFRNGDIKNLIIDEVYILAGENQCFKPKNDRLANLAKHIKTSVSASPNFSISVTQVYSINEKSLKNLYEKIKTEPSIQEIIFYPKTYGLKIYSYTILDTDSIDNIIKITQFNLQKTTSPDVYNLLSLENKTKIGIAYIPDMETSKKCKQWFKDYKKKILLVKCQLHTEKQKWIPMEMVENDLISSKETDDYAETQADDFEQEIVDDIQKNSKNKRTIKSNKTNKQLDKKSKKKYIKKKEDKEEEEMEDDEENDDNDNEIVEI